MTNFLPPGTHVHRRLSINRQTCCTRKERGCNVLESRYVSPNRKKFTVAVAGHRYGELPPPTHTHTLQLLNRLYCSAAHMNMCDSAYVITGQNACLKDPLPLATSVNAAAKLGMSEYLRDLILRKGHAFDDQTLQCAAEGGHLSTMQTVCECAHELELWPFFSDIRWNEDICVSAAHGGSLDCLRYAVNELGCPLNELTLRMAAEEGHALCYKYLRETSDLLESEKKCPNGMPDHVLFMESEMLSVLNNLHTGVVSRACRRYLYAPGRPGYHRAKESYYRISSV